jgi:hypothetical protein
LKERNEGLYRVGKYEGEREEFALEHLEEGF